MRASSRRHERLRLICARALIPRIMVRLPSIIRSAYIELILMLLLKLVVILLQGSER